VVEVTRVYFQKSAYVPLVSVNGVLGRDRANDGYDCIESPLCMDWILRKSFPPNGGAAQISVLSDICYVMRQLCRAA
jgi:hypothetical protein